MGTLSDSYVGQLASSIGSEAKGLVTNMIAGAQSAAQTTADTLSQLNHQYSSGNTLFSPIINSTKKAVNKISNITTNILNKFQDTDTFSYETKYDIISIITAFEAQLQSIESIDTAYGDYTNSLYSAIIDVYQKQNDVTTKYEKLFSYRNRLYQDFVSSCFANIYAMRILDITTKISNYTTLKQTLLKDNIIDASLTDISIVQSLGGSAADYESLLTNLKSFRSQIESLLGDVSKMFSFRVDDGICVADFHAILKNNNKTKRIDDYTSLLLSDPANSGDPSRVVKRDSDGTEYFLYFTDILVALKEDIPFQDGSKEFPYLISTKDDVTNNGLFTTATSHSGFYFSIINDLDLSNISFTDDIMHWGNFAGLNTNNHIITIPRFNQISMESPNITGDIYLMQSSVKSDENGTLASTSLKFTSNFINDSKSNFKIQLNVPAADIDKKSGSIFTVTSDQDDISDAYNFFFTHSFSVSYIENGSIDADANKEALAIPYYKYSDSTPSNFPHSPILEILESAFAKLTLGTLDEKDYYMIKKKNMFKATDPTDISAVFVRPSFSYTQQVFPVYTGGIYHIPQTVPIHNEDIDLTAQHITYSYDASSGSLSFNLSGFTELDMLIKYTDADGIVQTKTSTYHLSEGERNSEAQPTQQYIDTAQSLYQLDDLLNEYINTASKYNTNIDDNKAVDLKEAKSALEYKLKNSIQNTIKIVDNNIAANVKLAQQYVSTFISIEQKLSEADQNHTSFVDLSKTQEYVINFQDINTQLIELGLNTSILQDVFSSEETETSREEKNNNQAIEATQKILNVAEGVIRGSVEGIIELNNLIDDYLPMFQDLDIGAGSDLMHLCNAVGSVITEIQKTDKDCQVIPMRSFGTWRENYLNFSDDGSIAMCTLYLACEVGLRGYPSDLIIKLYDDIIASLGIVKDFYGGSNFATREGSRDERILAYITMLINDTNIKTFKRSLFQTSTSPKQQVLKEILSYEEKLFEDKEFPVLISNYATYETLPQQIVDTLPALNTYLNQVIITPLLETGLSISNLETSSDAAKTIINTIDLIITEFIFSNGNNPINVSEKIMTIYSLLISDGRSAFQLNYKTLLFAYRFFAIVEKIQKILFTDTLSDTVTTILGDPKDAYYTELLSNPDGSFYRAKYQELIDKYSAVWNFKSLNGLFTKMDISISNTVLLYIGTNDYYRFLFNDTLTGEFGADNIVEYEKLYKRILDKTVELWNTASAFAINKVVNAGDKLLDTLGNTSIGKKIQEKFSK